ncbi:LppA family lipoprotein [Amycolatopsis sp. NPDC047767]|uniref:LppA family lipoprotein n=1 Tax=Amycolatopsis sp. NPDC047767 TaxID=3156765 RepID=UPI0034550AC5
MNIHAARAAVGTVLALSLISCSGQGAAVNNEQNSTTQQFNELMQRPDIEQEAARYQEMDQKIRGALTATFPALTWQQRTQIAGSACGAGYPGLGADGEVRGLPNWMAAGNIPDAQWDKAVNVVHGVAQGYGFDSGQVIVSRPNDHEVVFRDRYQAELNIGTAVNTTLLVRTGCHLTAEAKKRGTPAPAPTA